MQLLKKEKQLFYLQFGVPLYGASFQGQVVHISSNEKGCTSFPDDSFKLDSANAVALVVRGGMLTSLLHVDLNLATIDREV